jgi:crotonobetainyl-CoA:carnitine CoA-transferase CaiB-like acyl-CoA transferase
MFEAVRVGGRELKVPALTPRLASTPGRTDFAGPALGAHNEDVFGTLLGMTREEIDALTAAGII